MKISEEVREVLAANLDLIIEKNLQELQTKENTEEAVSKWILDLRKKSGFFSEGEDSNLEEP